MAVTLLEIARIFATKVPGKIDADVLQLLWKVCLFSLLYIINTFIISLIEYPTLCSFLLKACLFCF